MPYLEKWLIRKIEHSSEEYPSLLGQIAKPAEALYFRGDFLAKDEKCFAIVGTRLASDYGKEIAFSVARDLTRAGLTIVSGMALGIDTWAHKGALENNGRTIAILGAGLGEKTIFPRQNLKLARAILEKNGCLISEYPPEYPAAKFTFLERNRIIAGISEGVLIVEAKIKSGALNTAAWARKQGKKIFAVPGDIHKPNSQGCHLLIKQGARLAESANDILKDLGIPRTIAQESRGSTPEEQMILDALRKGAADIDKIIEITKLPAQLVSVNLSIMEIDNKVKNLGGNTYALQH
ncbi:MAG: DNA-processing protein DprA [Candidatus Pacebacteria bacterium]|nr:DNA-processing protein DprA [Candidatus Paceibacterota bacterium]